MFNHSLLLPVALGVIILGLFYLFVLDHPASSGAAPKAEKQPDRWQVQCPKCQRWKKMQPIRRDKVLDEQEALQRRLLPGPRPRFLYEYKCAFCGHIWQEHYSEEQ